MASYSSIAVLENCHQFSALFALSALQVRKALYPFWLYFLFNDPDQIRPSTRFLLAHLAEVDDVAMVGTSRTVVDLLAPDVREDSLSVASILGNQATHLGDRRRDALHVSIIECEAHPHNDAALKALSGICSELLGIAMAARMEEVRGDQRNLATVKLEWAGYLAARDVDHTHNYRGLTRPFVSLPSTVDRPAMRADPAQPGGSGIALSDRIRSDKTEASARFQKIKSPSEEVRDEVGISVRFRMNLL
jgi:hypothetical protein